MPNIPTRVAGDAPQTSPGIPPSIQQVNLQGLGAGITAYMNKRKAAQDTTWADSAYMGIQKNVIDYFAKAELSPSGTAVEDYEDFWKKQTESLAKQAPSKEAFDRASNRLAPVSISAYDRAVNLRFKADSIATSNQLDSMIQNTFDITATTPDLEFLRSNIASIEETITEARGTIISEQAADNYLNKLPNLYLQAVDLWLLDNPELAKETLDEVKGIPGSVRASYEKKIKAAVSQGADIDLAMWNDDYKTHLANLSEGRSSSFDEDAYIAAHPKDRQVGLRKKLNDERDVAIRTHEFRTAIRGATPAEAAAELEKLNPANMQEPSHRQQALYKSARSTYSAYTSLIETDPYSAAAQSQEVEHWQNMYNQADDSQKPWIYRNMVLANTAIQKRMGVNDGELKYLPVDQLKQIAGDLNKGSGKEVVTRINELNNLYGEYYPDIFRNLVELPKGAGIDPSLLLVNDHIGFSEEGEVIAQPWVYSFIDASRMSLKDMGKTEDDYNTAFEKAGKNIFRGPQFKKLWLAMSAAGGSEGKRQAVQVQEALAKYSLFLDSPNQNNLEMAYNQVIDSVLAVQEANGVEFTIPRNQPGFTVDDKGAEQIAWAADKLLDFGFVTKYQAPASLGGDTLQYASVKGKIAIPDVSMMVSVEKNNAALDQGTAAFLNIGDPLDRVREVLAQQGYWTESKDGKGLMLMAKSGGGRNIPVLGNNGEPVTISFKKLLPMRKAWGSSMSSLINLGAE